MSNLARWRRAEKDMGRVFCAWERVGAAECEWWQV